MCWLHAIWCPAPYKMCCLDLTISWAVCLSMLCIYLACHHRKRFIVLFRLAHWVAIEDCTLFQTSLWVSVCHIRAKQLPGPLAIGSCDPLLFGLQAGSQACARTSWWAKGAHLECTLGCKATTPGPLEPTNLSHHGSSRRRHSAIAVFSN